jgi:hypothetical protein
MQGNTPGDTSLTRVTGSTRAVHNEGDAIVLVMRPERERGREHTESDGSTSRGRKKTTG